MLPDEDELIRFENERLQEEVARLRAGIREHRDQKGHDRCWLDDQKLYALLPEKAPEDTGELPPKPEFLAGCERYYELRKKNEHQAADHAARMFNSEFWWKRRHPDLLLGRHSVRAGLERIKAVVEAFFTRAETELLSTDLDLLDELIGREMLFETAAKLDDRAAKERNAGGTMFMGRPDRWYEAHKRRCTRGHVAFMVLKSEGLGREACLECGAPVFLTFPEDEGGSLE